MCVLGQPEPVGSVLMFLSGYDTLEYFWVKATAVSVRLRILFVTLQNTNNQHLQSIFLWSIGWAPSVDSNPFQLLVSSKSATPPLQKAPSLTCVKKLCKHIPCIIIFANNQI